MKTKAILTAILCILATLTVSAYTGTYIIDGLTYNIVTKSKKATLINNEEITLKGKLAIPATVTYKDEDGETVCNVVGIEANAFDNQQIDEVTIPSSVTYIGKYAFVGCKYLTAVKIDGNNLTEIGEGAFQNCRELSRINLPNSLTVLPNMLFASCGYLWDVNIPDKVTAIGEGAFANTGIITITLPNTLKTISADAFSNCTRLETITIPNSVTSLGTAVFSNSGLTSVTIPGSLATIPNYAFSGCSELTSVTIAEGVTTIADHAFAECSSMTTVTLPKSLKSIAYQAFRSCKALNAVYIADVTAWSQVEFNFDESNPLTFAGHLYLKYALKSVNINNGPTYIGKYTFNHCKDILAVKIPGSVTSIGESAFESCGKLKTVVVADGVKSIGNYAFSSCGDLEDFYCEATSVPTVGTKTFANSYVEEATLHVPASAVDAYKKDSYWGKFGTIVAMTGTDPLGGIQECAKPTVSYKNGEITFNCDTKDVTYDYTIKGPDSFGTKVGSSRPLNVTYVVTVIAKREGYIPSDMTEVRISWTETAPDEEDPSNVKGDVNGDGLVNIADIVAITNLIAKGNNDAATDANGDKQVDAKDIVTVMKQIAKKK